MSLTVPSSAAFISHPISPIRSVHSLTPFANQLHRPSTHISLSRVNIITQHIKKQQFNMMPSPTVAAAILLLTPILSLCILILLRVAFPTIFKYPWRLPAIIKGSDREKKDKATTVVFAGSFNPPHWGHLVMIRYLAERYGSVICCIGFNPSKRYDVTAQQRADILKEMVSSISLNNVRVDVVSGYIWRHARAQNAKLFFRGIRTWAEDGADELKLLVQNTYGPALLGRIWPINTVFLEGDPRYRGVSSTLVRGLCARIKKNEEKEAALEELKQLVPDSVVDKVVQVYGT